MNILITGATGPVGNDLLRFLSKNNTIYSFYRNKKNKITNIKNVNWIKTNSLDTYVFPKNLNIQCVIHCAVDQKYLKLDKKKYLNLNLKIIKNLINNFKKLKKDKIFINLSSIEVYGHIKKKILYENYKPFQQNPYGLMKYKCEKILKKSNINYVNLRLPGVLCKFSKKLKNRPWINLISHKLKKNEDVQIYNSKSKFNNLISTDELKKIIIKILKSKAVIKKNFNVGSSKPLNLKMIINMMKKKLGSKSLIIESETKKISFLISIQKIEKFLNYKISSTRSMIKKHLSYLQAS